MKKATYHLVPLPCKPVIKKYISAVFGDPVFASKKTTLGLYIIGALSKERYTYSKEYRDFQEYFMQPVYAAEISVRISRWQFDNLGFSFTDEKIIELNQFMECVFEEHLCDWISARALPGIERKKLIEEFCALHDISLDVEDGDISLETLIKTEYRKRKQIQREQSAGKKTRAFILRTPGRPSSRKSA